MFIAVLSFFKNQNKRNVTVPESFFLTSPVFEDIEITSTENTTMYSKASLSKGETFEGLTLGIYKL